MSKTHKIDYTQLMEVIDRQNNPFSRENCIAKLKANLGEGSFIWYDFGSGIAASTTNYRLHQNTLATLKSNISGAILIFNLSNEIGYIYQDKKRYQLKKNHYLLGFNSDNFTVDIELKKNTHYHTFNVGLKEELLAKLGHNLENLETKMNEAKIKGYTFLEGGIIDPEQMETLNYFKEKKDREYLTPDLYLESKAINLIHYSIKKVVHNTTAPIHLTSDTINSLTKAKKIIMKEYSSDLSIKKIAYKSAINECYLKKEFKAYYGMTVYEMIQSHRLEVSKEFLQKNLSVKETALKVGYKHTGHFSKLFNQAFGQSPSLYRKQFIV